MVKVRNRSALPNVNTSSKEQANAWMRKTLQVANLAFSAASFAALLVANGVAKEESKQLALKWSGHLGNTATGIGLFEKVWDMLKKKA